MVEVVALPRVFLETLSSQRTPSWQLYLGAATTLELVHSSETPLPFTVFEQQSYVRMDFHRTLGTWSVR